MTALRGGPSGRSGARILPYRFRNITPHGAQPKEAPMPWARFDDRFPSNRKVRLLSDGAFRLYVSAICWSAENLTDGVIKTAELRLVADVRATRARAKELVEAGLFDVVDGVGWKIHDYHEYNPTAEQVRADRAQRTARQQRWRQKKQGATPDPDPPGSTPDVDASTNASRTRRETVLETLPRPGPSRPAPVVVVQVEREVTVVARETKPLTL